MNLTQNDRLMQVTSDTLIVGVDVGSQTHFCRAFDWRGFELSRRVFKFSNTGMGFLTFLRWTEELMNKTGMKKVIVGCEPTGCYWLTFQKFLLDHDIQLVTVNPYTVNRSMELDDNSPEKSDLKDPKTIALLVKDGRFSTSYLPGGIYAEIREASVCGDQIMKQHVRLSNQIQGWLQKFFPEYFECYADWNSTSGLMLLKEAPLPEDILKIGAGGINQIWRDAKVRAVGIKRAQTLVEVAQNSVGLEAGEAARLEIWILVNDYLTKTDQLKRLDGYLEEKVKEVPNVEKLLIDKTPDQRKLSFMLWTRAAVRQLIQEKYNIAITLRNMSEYLKRWGMTCQCPTKKAYFQDNVKMNAFMHETYPAIVKQAKKEDAVIFWGDETGINNQAYHVKGFAPKGQTFSKMEKNNMISAISNQGTCHFLRYDANMTQQRFIDFMGRLVKDTDRKVLFIVDNLKVHHGKIVAEWLLEHKDEIELFYTSPYSPEINPDEYLNHNLKQNIHSGIIPHAIYVYCIVRGCSILVGA